jgi:hypothetical protein
MAIQEEQLLGIPEKYHFDFLELLHNPDFVTEIDASRQMVSPCIFCTIRWRKSPSLL